MEYAECKFSGILVFEVLCLHSDLPKVGIYKEQAF